MTVRRMDHVGIVVNDFAAAKAFFLALGLEVAGEADMQGELVDRVTGLQGVTSKIVMLRVPNGETAIELSQFHSPKEENAVTPPRSNRPGIRHVTFEVDDLDAPLAGLQKHGADLVGEIQTYENIYKLCYLRGPEGIILELAQPLAR